MVGHGCPSLLTMRGNAWKIITTLLENWDRQDPSETATAIAMSDGCGDESKVLACVGCDKRVRVIFFPFFLIFSFPSFLIGTSIPSSHLFLALASAVWDGRGRVC